MRPTASPNANRSRFYLVMSCVFLAIALTGFSTTFFWPMARGTFAAPPIVYGHGALLFGWLLFLITQSALVQGRSLRTHQRLGWLGVCLCAGIMMSGVLVGLYATRRDLAAGGGSFVLGQFVNILFAMVLFGTLVGAAIVLRRDGERHKRLLLLATISILGPAWLRFRHFMPFVPNPFVVFSLIADSLVLVVIVRDFLADRRIHPTYLWAGGAMVLVHLVELVAIESQPWLRLARWLLGMGTA